MAAARPRARVSGKPKRRAKRGPLVLEVNSSPGLEGIENATKVDVAEKIIEFVEKKVAESEAQDPLRKKVDA